MIVLKNSYFPLNHLLSCYQTVCCRKAVNHIQSCSLNQPITTSRTMVSGKTFESNIAWGVDELHQTFWFEQFFNGKLCCRIHDLLIVPIIFFWIGLLGAISGWMSSVWVDLTFSFFSALILFFPFVRMQTSLTMFQWSTYPPPPKKKTIPCKACLCFKQ